MMFMMPMPATRREIGAMAPMTMLKSCFVRRLCSSRDSGTRMRAFFQSSRIRFEDEDRSLHSIESRDLGDGLAAVGGHPRLATAPRKSRTRTRIPS
jgi:hypothetical protein